MDNVIFKEKRRAVKEDKNIVKTNKLLSLLFSFGLILISIFLVYNGFRSLQIAFEKKAILVNAEKEVTDLRLKNIKLLLDLRKIETDDYTETDIRNRLNYSKKNEKVFVIPEEVLDLAKVKVDQILAVNPQQKMAKNTYEVWIDFFKGDVNDGL